MNYYERHLGDYAKDTAHLSMVEHGAYGLLLDRYYGTEAGIPADQAYRITRARSKEEKTAVDCVLAEFFFLDRDSGVWRNKRADEEIAKYLEKKPKAEEKREGDKERQRKARERRKAIFEELSSYGVHLPWNAKTEHAHTELERVKSQQRHEPVTPPVTRDVTATSNQSPVTSPQTPFIKPIESEVNGKGGTPAGAVCARLKSDGILDVNPMHPRLLALLNAGMTPDEIASIGPEAKQKQKGFAWILATAEGRRRDAANVVAMPKRPEKPWYITAQGIEDEGQRRKIAKLPGEHFQAYRARVYQSAEITEDMVRKAMAEFPQPSARQQA